MSSPRGLTLVEVLVSLSLLSALSWGLIPLFRDSLQAAPQAPPWDLVDLDEAIDQLIEEYSELETLRECDSVAWPSAPGRTRIRLETLPTDAADRVWIAFSCEGLVVSRVHWLPEPPPEEGDA